MATAWAASALADDPARVEADLRRQERASARIGKLDGRYVQGLIGHLGSANPYERLLALERLRRLAVPVPEEGLAAVVRLLDDTLPLHSGRCLQALAQGDTTAQGIIYEQAMCTRYEKLTCAALARDILASHPAKKAIGRQLVARVLERPDSAEAVATLVRSTDGHSTIPVLSALGSARDRSRRLALLVLALELPNGAARPADLQTLASLLYSDDTTIGNRAAAVIIRVAFVSGNPPDPTARKLVDRAVERIHGALRAGDDHVLEDLVHLGEGAAPFVGALTARLRESKGSDRVLVLRALGAIGEPAAAALPLIVRILSDARRHDLHRTAVEAIGRIGRPAGKARGALLAYATATPDELPVATAALVQAEAKLTPAEFRRVERTYRKRCAEAGSIPFFSLGRDDWCAAVADSLETLADSAGLRFTRVGWDG